MPAQYVKPYVERGKNDAADAEAICEAVTRPTMRFVPVKMPASLLNALAHLLLRRSGTPDGLNNPKTAACRLDAVGATRLKRLTIRAFNIRASRP
jgi:transposase